MFSNRKERGHPTSHRSIGCKQCKGGDRVDSNLLGNRFEIPNRQRNRVCKEIGFPQDITFQIYKKLEFQKVTLANNFQIYKEVGNLQNRPFEYNFSNL